jgi:hypothetical protein
MNRLTNDKLGRMKKISRARRSEIDQLRTINYELANLVENLRERLLEDNLLLVLALEELKRLDYKGLPI